MTDTDLTLEDLVSHDRWIRALARRLVADEAAADDLAQDAWAAALEKPPASGPTRAWIGRVLKNLHAMRLRSDQRRTRREQAVARDESLLSVAELWDREQTRRRVAEAVFALDEPCRSAILHRYFQDLTPREIAARLGLSSSAVETRLRRGREQLRHRLDGEFGRRATWCAALLPLAGVVSAAAAGGAVTAGSAGIGPKLIGVFAMGTKLKIGAALVVAACLAVAFWPEMETVDSLPPAGSETERERHDSPPAAKATPEKTATPAAAQPTATPGPALTETEGISAAAPATASITGTVHDESGHPIEGALLRFIYRDPTDNRWKSPAHWLEKTTRTDARGRYAFHELSTDLGSGSPELSLYASANGFGEDRTNVRLGFRHDFVLHVGGRIEGRVIEQESGRPIPGAKVSAMASETRGHGSAVGRSVLADADGRFVFEGVRPTLYSVDGSASDHVTDYRRSIHIEVRPRRTTTLEITLSRGLSVRGRVVDASAKPVPGATVGDGRRDVVTGPDGRFSIGGLRVESGLKITAPGKVAVSERVGFLRSEAAAGVAEREYCLVDGATVRGRITDASGVPLRGATVRISNSRPRIQADENGRFEVALDRIGGFGRWAVCAPGFATTLLPPMKLAAGEVRDDLVVVLARGGEITGRVLTERGEPVAGQTVVIRTWPRRSGRLDDVYRRASSASDGRYRFDGLATGTYELTANGDRWPDSRCATRGRRQGIRVEDGATTSGVDLVPTQRISLSGRVLDQADHPIPGVQITAWVGPSRAWTDADGRFTLDNIPERCPVSIDAKKAEFSLLQDPARSVSCPTAETGEMILRMARMSPGIRGHVVRADTGAPVPSFWVRLQPSSGKHPVTGAMRFRPRYNRQFFQDAAGAFHLNRDRGARPHVLDAGTDSGLVASGPVLVPSAGQAEVVLPQIRLVRGSAVHGKVFAPDGTPIAKACVQATHPVDGRMLGDGWYFTQADGVFELTGLPPGPVLLHAKHDDWYAVQTTIKVGVGTRTYQDLQLGAEGALLRIEVREIGGKPVVGARFLLFTPDGEAVYWDSDKYFALYRARFLQQGRRSFSDRDFRHELEQTAADGSVERRFLPPNDYVVQITHIGFKQARRPVTVRLNAKNVVEVVLARRR